MRKKYKKKNSRFLTYHNQFRDKIFNFYMYRVGFNRAVAEDLCSEAFLKAFKNFDSFDEERPFQAWIYRIAKNHLINHYAKSGREVDIDRADKATSPMLENIDHKHELKLVFEEIRKLKKYFQEVLLLRYLDGLSNKEIAELLNKDEGAVRAQISRALAFLRKKIKIHE